MTIESTLKKAFMNRTTFMTIMRKVGGTRNKASEMYAQLKRDYETYLLDNNLIKPCYGGVPTRRVLDYLDKVGVKEEDIIRAFQDE